MERFNNRYKRDMKTAIEWLEEQMETWGHFPRWMRDDIVKQAKEMEKEQIIEVWNIRAKIDGVLTYTDNRTAEQYYNETFKSE
jgi:ribosome recycling factor